MFTQKDNIWLLFNQICFICDLNNASEIGICDACQADLILPVYPCPLCAMPRVSATAQCTYCQGRPQAFDSAWTALVYDFPINSIFAQIKQGKNPTALHWMGRLMADCHPQLESLEDYYLLPVPMHPVDRLIRGFNQTEILARYLSAKLGKPPMTELISKSLRTAHQATLNRSQRLSNLRESFEVHSDSPPARVILVDDVMTTGATAHTLASLLKERGTLEVRLWALSRAL